MNFKQMLPEIKKKLPMIIMAVLLLIAIIVILILCLRSCNGNTPDTPSDTTPTVIGGEPIPEDVGKQKDIGSTTFPHTEG